MRLKSRFISIVIGVILVPLVHVCQAQTIGIGTTKGGATAQISTAISKVVSANSDIQVRPQAMANTQQYIPIVNEGKIELGLANVPQTRFAASGTGMSEGKPNPNLRMLVSLFSFRPGIMVRGDSSIKTIADMKGQKMPKFKDRALGDYIYGGYLKAGGLSYDDVTAVPASNFPTMWKMFKEGQIDSAIVAVGSKPAFDFQAAFGSVRFVDFPMDQSAVAHEYLPGSYLTELKNDGTPGESAGIHTLTFEYALFANKDVGDDVVAQVLGAMHDNPDALKATSPLWKSFTPEGMSKDVGVEYHPGAVSFYKDKGIWQR